LLFLDAVFHVAALAVYILVKFLLVTGQVGHYEAWIGPVVTQISL